MTAAGLDYVSDGRYILGLGVSGPQVIEGFHGVPYDAPIQRTREVLEICRKVWKRESLQYRGNYYHVPLPDGQGTGLGKLLKLINHPVRECIPVLLAALGPKNVALAAELAEGWQPIFFLPERADMVWSEALRTGRAKRDPSLGELEIYARPSPGHRREHRTPARIRQALPGAVHRRHGAKSKNFYHALATKYGYGAEADRIQELYLAGRKDEAAKVVPDELVRDISLIGPPGFVKERIGAFREAGVTVLYVTPLADTAAGRVKLIEQLRELI
jgi:F420-dependent oxidoreductase-like protein